MTEHKSRLPFGKKERPDALMIGENLFLGLIVGQLAIFSLSTTSDESEKIHVSAPMNAPVSSFWQVLRAKRLTDSLTEEQLQKLIAGYKP